MQYSSCHFLVRSYYINGNSSQLPVPTAIFGSAVEHFQDSRPGNLGLRLERPFLIKLLLADWPDYLRGTLSSRRSLEQNLVRSSKLELPRFSLEDLLFYSVTLSDLFLLPWFIQLRVECSRMAKFRTFSPNNGPGENKWREASWQAARPYKHQTYTQSGR